MTMSGAQTVLVVEDERELNDLLVDLFGLTGYRVLRAFDGGEAYRLIRAEHPDVVVLDLMLPTMTGQDILRSSKDDPATREIPFIVVTGFAERLGEPERRLAASVITKPFEIDLLLGEVERVVAANTGAE